MWLISDIPVWCFVPGTRRIWVGNWDQYWCWKGTNPKCPRMEEAKWKKTKDIQRVKRWNHRWRCRKAMPMSFLKGWKWLRVFRFSSPTNQTLMNWHELVYQLKNSIIYFPPWSKPWSFRGLLATSREAHLAAKGRFSCELPGLLQRAGTGGWGLWEVADGNHRGKCLYIWLVGEKTFLQWDVQMKIVSSKSGVACRLM